MPVTREREQEIERHVVGLGERARLGVDRSANVGCVAWLVAIPGFILLGRATSTWVGVVTGFVAVFVVFALAAAYDGSIVRRCARLFAEAYPEGEEHAVALRVVSELQGSGGGLQKFKDEVRTPSGVRRVRMEAPESVMANALASPAPPPAVPAPPQPPPAPEPRAQGARVIPLEPYDPTGGKPDERD